MKAKRFAALWLALILTLSLLAVPAGAVSFADMQNHWAREDVEYLAGLGVVKGTSDTTFSPDQKMTACEALLFCSRATGVSAGDKARIAADWADWLGDTLPESVYSWTAEEMSVCLETGIISTAELEAMCQSGALLKSISRENLAMYLVRAMQLEPMANNLTSYSMSFADTASISQVLRPYVYLLNTYGIVKGNTANEFMPQGSLTRGEMATMLRRTIDFMDEQGIYAELPAYTDYAWVGGVITSVSDGGSGATVVTLTSNLAGTTSVSLPSGIPVYENNIRTTAAAIRTGRYLRVNLDGSGAPQSARLGGVLTQSAGTVTAVDQGSVTLSVDGASKRFDIDRFTKVQVGERVGDQTLIDPAAGYTQAQCWVDGMGHLAELKLSGGTMGTEGLIVGVTTTAAGQLLTVSAFNGERNQYTLPAGAAVTVNGQAGTIGTGNQGDYVSLRVSNDDPALLVSAAVDTVSDYVQGPVRSVDQSQGTYRVTITDSVSGLARTYSVSDTAQVRYNGAEIGIKDLARDSYATLQLSGEQAVAVDAYPGSSVTQGVLQSISYGDPTTITVRTAQGSNVSFDVDLTDLPTVKRDGAASTIDKLRAGDTVKVTVRYSQVEEIEATSQSATCTGTVSRLVQDAQGITLDMAFSDGSAASYQVSESVPVTKEGKASTIYAIRPGDTLALTVSGDQVTAVEVTESASTVNQISGTILLINAGEKTLFLQLSDGSTVTADVNGASFVTAAGSSYSLSKLAYGDRVQLYGAYSGDRFQATLIIKL